MFKNYLIKALEAEHLSTDALSGIYKSMKKMAETLGIDVPGVYLLPEKAHPSQLVHGLRTGTNAGSISKDAILVSRPLMRLYGAKDFKKPVSKELEAVMAHEMHHCGHRTSLMMMSRAPVFLVPAATVTAIYLYDRAHAKAKKENNISPENMAKHIEEATKETEAQLPKMEHSQPSQEDHYSFLHNLLHNSKYLALTAAGIGAGFVAARYGARHHEFAADRFAAKMVGKEPMINALRKLHEAAGQSISEHPQREKFKGLFNETILAHPSFAERAANIRRS